MTKLTYMENIIIQIALTDLKYEYQDKARKALADNEIEKDTFWKKQAERVELVKIKLLEIEREQW